MRSYLGLRRVASLLTVFGLVLSIGCQTWLGGMTLPSPEYLKDNPDYIPKGPQFPLPRELAAMQAASGGTAPAVPGPEAPGGNGARPANQP